MRTVTLLALTACAPTDSGLDRSVVTGTLVIPPVTATDSRGNDTVAEAQGLGADGASALSWRTVIVTGTVAGWPEPPSPTADTDGDPDNYAFTPAASGTFSFSFTFPTDPGSGGDTADTAATLDGDVFELQIVDPASFDEETGAGVLWSTSTDGSGGVVTFEYDVAGGTEYVLRVLPIRTDSERDTLEYTLVVSGSAPDDSTILVGAYAGTDPTVAENPLGGTNATGWTYDPSTYTWTGAWKMMWFRSVTAVEDENPDDLFEPSPIVVEGAEKAYVRAGSLTSLNAGPAAGALYTTTSLEIQVNGGEYELESPLVLDGVAPKVIGIQVEETLPDQTVAEIDLADYTLIEATLVTQDIGMLSGLGYVDVVTGSSVMDPAYSGWNGTNDSDAFAFTVPETMNVRMVARWDDAAADIDFGIWYPDPDYGLIDIFASWGDTYCLTGANPEVCETVVSLEPDTTYYLLALGYLGTDEEPYTVELEWLP